MNRQAPKIVIVIPVYNEKETIHQVIGDLLQYHYGHIVVVNDGSSQNILEAIENLPVHYLQHRVNLGQGAALETGFEYARKIDADIVISFDADGQHDVADIQSMISELLNGEADVILGSRFLAKPAVQIPRHKKIVLNLARYVNFFFCGLLLTDAHNGLRALNKNALEKISITENRMAHASEILFEIKKHSLRYKEVSSHISYTDYSKEKGQSAWDSIKIVFDIVLHKMFR